VLLVLPTMLVVRLLVGTAARAEGTGSGRRLHASAKPAVLLTPVAMPSYWL
jgi:hypothetical protein